MADELGPQEEEGPPVLDVREGAGRVLRGPEPEVPVQPRAGGFAEQLAAPGGSPFMANVRCGWVDCAELSELHPHLILRPPDGVPGGEAEAHMSLGVCAKHATTNIDELVSDEGWAVLCETFRQVGRVEPERSKTEVRWLSLDE